MSASALSYVPCPDATSEIESSALGRVYRFALSCTAKKEAVEPRLADDPEDARKDRNARTQENCSG